SSGSSSVSSSAASSGSSSASSSSGGCMPTLHCTSDLCGSQNDGCGKTIDCGLCQGAACSMDSDCGAGHCIDKVCWGTKWRGMGRACSKAKKGYGTDGACEPIKAGADPDAECADQGVASCGQDGFCDGMGGCERYANGVQCDQGCNDSTDDGHKYISQCASGT